MNSIGLDFRNKAIFFGYMMVLKADLVGQIATPERPSRSWHILCGRIWDLIFKGHLLAQKHLSK